MSLKACFSLLYVCSSFDVHYKYQHIDDGPIEVATLVMFSAATGKPHQAWGGSLFYMPHGLTIDHKGSFWVTDVAMHQVFKFSSFGDKKPSLVLGQAFKPGGGYNSFCQPTSVAVEKSGVFYVADGWASSKNLNNVILLSTQKRECAFAFIRKQIHDTFFYKPLTTIKAEHDVCILYYHAL